MSAFLERFELDLLTDRPSAAAVLRQSLGAVPVHWHDYYELVYVLDGESEHVCNGTSERVSGGSSMLLTPTDLHGFRPVGSGPLECLNVMIPPWVAERYLDPALASSSRSAGLSIEDMAAARPDFERLWAESRTRRPGSPQVVEAMVACILVEYNRRLPVEPAAGAVRDDPVRSALSYIDQHFREPLTLAQVAAHVFLSPNYFSERFHEVAGTSFQVYLQRARLRFARALLSSTTATITEVALAAGFNSVSHFGRAFRAAYGVAPRTDREQRRLVPG